MKSNLNLSIEIAHDPNIPDAQALSRIVAEALHGALIGTDHDPMTAQFGRVTSTAHRGQGVRVFLQSAAIEGVRASEVRSASEADAPTAEQPVAADATCRCLGGSYGVDHVVGAPGCLFER